MGKSYCIYSIEQDTKQYHLYIVYNKNYDEIHEFHELELRIEISVYVFSTNNNY